VRRASRLLTAVLVGWWACAYPSSAAADIFVSPFMGLKFKGSTNELDLDTDDGSRETKLSVGLSGVVLADSGVGLELEVAHQPRFFERQGLATGLITRSGVTTLGGNVMLALPISVTRESLRPFAVVGLGWMHASANDLIGFNEVSNDFLGLTLGVGAVGFLTDVVGVRFDLRHLRSVSSADTSSNTSQEGERATLRFWRATVGVVFR
jgi:Outer membrane protein beta-barrel domain